MLALSSYENVTPELLPAGIVTAPAGADDGPASAEESAPPLQSWVPAGGDVGAVTLASAITPEKATATPANTVVQTTIARRSLRGLRPKPARVSRMIGAPIDVTGHHSTQLSRTAHWFSSAQVIPLSHQVPSRPNLREVELE